VKTVAFRKLKMENVTSTLIMSGIEKIAFEISSQSSHVPLNNVAFGKDGLRKVAPLLTMSQIRNIAFEISSSIPHVPHKECRSSSISISKRAPYSSCSTAERPRPESTLIRVMCHISDLRVLKDGWQRVSNHSACAVSKGSRSKSA
jgi:hypothetical protein